MRSHTQKIDRFQIQILNGNFFKVFFSQRLESLSFQVGVYPQAFAALLFTLSIYP